MKLKTILVINIFVLFFFVFYFNGYSQTSTQFKFTYSDKLSSKPITGRLILVMSADTLIEPDMPNPFRPFITFGMDFKNWKPGENLILNNHNSESFLSNLDELEGYYSLKAFVDTDSTSSLLFKDGTYYSEKQILEIEPNKSNIIDVNVNNVLSGKAFKESKNIKLLKVKSELLSDFYNVSTYIEAAVILPESYDQNDEKSYPVVFVFPGFGSTHIKVTQDDFHQKRYGMSDFGEEKIFVFLNQDCRYGFHVFANSENNGPRATSFITEFIPALEKQYRVARKSNKRFLVGQSSGAWAALWLQINYPDRFGMVWAGSPDPVDFHNFVGHNLYRKDANLFFNSEGRITSSVRTPGIYFTLKDWSDMETALGEGGQLQSFEAVFGRKDKDRKPEQMFDRKTGRVYPHSIEHWKKYDINLFIKKNADELREKLADKINIVVAANDDFYLDGAVRLLKETLDSLNFKANIKILKSGAHSTWSDEIRTEMHKKMEEKYSGYSN
ncbi:MAG: alpha/beta hydrolase-fold protein [Ignavibacteriaceae bacterium]